MTSTPCQAALPLMPLVTFLNGVYKFYHDPLLSGTIDFQEWSKTHNMVSHSMIELSHRVQTHYLPLYFPEADRFHRSSRSDWFLAFLECDPSPYIITEMRKEAFLADAWVDPSADTSR